MNRLILAGALTALAAGGASGAIVVELGDAGELPGTAQNITGAGDLSAIFGALTANDVDMYRIFIADPANFSADTNNATTGGLDTQLFLFQLNGLGIAVNDDQGGSLQALFPAGNGLYSGLAPGEYLLAISSFNRDAVSAGGLIFPNTFPGVFGPTGPGGGSAITGWTGSGPAGDYRIDLTGAVIIPLPGVAGMAMAALGVGAVMRRRRMA